MPEDKITLNRLIAERGIRKDMIADELGIVPSALSHKLKGRRRFTEQELKRLSEILEIHIRIIRKAVGPVRT